MQTVPIIRPFRRPVVFAAIILLCLGNAAIASPAASEAKTPPTDSAAGAVSPSQLSRSIDEVLARRQFAWRMPREKEQESSQKSWLSRMIDAMIDTVLGWLKALARALVKAGRWVWDKLRQLAPQRSPSEFSGGGLNWIQALRTLLFLIILAAACWLGVLIVRALHRRRRTPLILAAAVAGRPDLTDENILADELPEEGWLKMARQLMEQGNLRLALRALYLAGLAHLAARQLIVIAAFKSNREYEAELRRRARALEALHGAFSQNVAAFDRAWYGLYEVTQEMLQQFQTNLEQIRAC
jgi:hypothetical protein